jgi:hypothetical protein
VRAGASARTSPRGFERGGVGAEGKARRSRECLVSVRAPRVLTGALRSPQGNTTGGPPGEGGAGWAPNPPVVKGYLEPGERVQLEARPHGAALAVPLARALVIAAVGGVLVVLGSTISWVLGAVGAVQVAVGAGFALAAVLRWDRTRLVLTTDKLLVVYGVVRRRAAAVRLSRVGAIEVEQSFLGHLLGYGTLVAGELEIPYVPEPAQIHRVLR